MSAGAALQAAIVSALQYVDGLAGVYDGPPARAGYPYAVLDAATESDWSHKSGEGRELLVAMTIWDDQPARLHGLADAAEGLVRDVASTGDWQVVTMRLLRRRLVRDVAGPWAAVLDFRARLLAG